MKTHRLDAVPFTPTIGGDRLVRPLQGENGFIERPLRRESDQVAPFFWGEYGVGLSDINDEEDAGLINVRWATCKNPSAMPCTSAGPDGGAARLDERESFDPPFEPHPPMDSRARHAKA